MVMKVIVIIRMPSTVARAAMLHTRAGEDRVRRVQGSSFGGCGITFAGPPFQA